MCWVKEACQGAGCTRSEKKARVDGEELVGHVENISKAVVDIVKSMTDDRKDLNSSNIDARVEATVRKELVRTKQLMIQQRDTIAELKNMLICLKHCFK